MANRSRPEPPRPAPAFAGRSAAIANRPSTCGIRTSLTVDAEIMRAYGSAYARSDVAMRYCP